MFDAMVLSPVYSFDDSAQLPVEAAIDSFKISIGAGLKTSVRDSIGDRVWASIDFAGSLRWHLFTDIKADLRSSLKHEGHVKDRRWNRIWGRLDASVLAYRRAADLASDLFLDAHLGPNQL